MAFYEFLGYVRAASRYDKSNAEGSDRLYHIYVKFLRGAGGGERGGGTPLSEVQYSSRT